MKSKLFKKEFDLSIIKDYDYVSALGGDTIGLN